MTNQNAASSCNPFFYSQFSCTKDELKLSDVRFEIIDEMTRDFTKRE